MRFRDDKKAAEQEQKESEVEKYGKDSGHKWIGKTVSRFVLSGDDDELADEVVCVLSEGEWASNAARSFGGSMITASQEELPDAEASPFSDHGLPLLDRCVLETLSSPALGVL